MAADRDPTLGDALDRAGAPALAGRLAGVYAPVGVGKTAVLVHAAFDALRAGQRVLHVAVTDSVDHVRAHYDALQQGEAIDLHLRMIHSDRQLTVERLRAHLALLANAAGFRPQWIAVDGLEGDPGSLASELAALAHELGVAVWMTARSPDSRSALHGALALRLAPDANGLVHVLFQVGDEDRPLGLALGADGRLQDANRSAGRRRINASDVTLYAGGATGSEAAFGKLASRWGMTEVNFTFPGHVQARLVGSVTLTERELVAGDVSLEHVSKILGRTYSTEGTLIRKVLQTLWHMVSRAQKVFVVGQIQKDDTVIGGTGWSVELARTWNKDLWVYDPTRAGWFRWDGRSWAPGEPVIDVPHIAGTGTRALDDGSRAALEALFVRSFGPPLH